MPRTRKKAYSLDATSGGCGDMQSAFRVAQLFAFAEWCVAINLQESLERDEEVKQGAKEMGSTIGSRDLSRPTLGSTR